MEKNIILLIGLCLLFATVAPAQQEASFKSRFGAEQLNKAPAGLIPLPQEWAWEGDYLELSGLYLPESEALSPPLIREWKNIARFYGLSETPDVSLEILFRPDDGLGPEAYQLAVSRKGIEIRASAEAGRFYALQTLRQLISKDGKSHRLPLCTISDWPAYPVRGFMIDVGRNFQSLESLKKQLDIMSQYKLNTFHWHLTDRPAWRIESKRYPQLTDAANHRPTRDPGKFYSYDDIRELTGYARQRHITIIPEIDMPGHSDSFVEAMGVKMESEEGMEILKNVLEEFFAEISPEDCPIIHIGSDEVRIDNPEEFISRMVGICEAHNRKVVIWNPGLNATDNVIRQTWQGRHLIKGDYKEIDSWNNYVNNGEPMTQVLRLFFKPIGYPSDNEVIGGILCFWPDVNLGQETDAFRQNPVYPSMLTYAWASWTADVLQAPEAYYTVLPPKNSEAFRYFSAFERILAGHKQKFFADEPFQYFVQCDKEWKLIGPFSQHDENLLAGPPKEHYISEGRELAWKEAAGNTLIIRDRFKQGGYYPDAEPGQTYYALTYIHSDEARKVKAWIGFETPLRANRTYTGIPGPGQWDPNGGAVWANDEPLPPPEWENPGWKPTKTDGWGTPEEQELPWRKEELYWTREPTEVPLTKGWNKIVARIPGSTAYQNWMFTFVPLDMEGLRFSTNPEGHSTYYYQKK